MNFEEHAAKPVLAKAGIAIPRGRLCATPEEAAIAASDVGPCVIKAQVPTGKRGKAGGIKLAGTPAEAVVAAGAILRLEIGGYKVSRLLVEEQAKVAREFYAAILNDSASRGPLLLFSTEGGMDIEEIAATRPQALLRHPIDITRGFDRATATTLLSGTAAGRVTDQIADILAKLYQAYRASDAELIEINPLAELQDGRVVALDCKLVVDDAALPRQPELAKQGAPEQLTELEKRGRAIGLRYIELDGTVGVLANGAGLTMTTMDAVRHYGGRPANFLEIGGEAYTQATPALELVLSNPNVKSLVVNFCGAFARTDVMAEGVVKAWESLRPKLPVFFSIHGTGEDEAIRLVKERLGIEPYDLMDDAIKAAVEAAR
jgi:succinyl-CoA synthetase beta subunit